MKKKITFTVVVGEYWERGEKTIMNPSGLVMVTKENAIHYTGYDVEYETDGKDTYGDAVKALKEKLGRDDIMIYYWWWE